MYHTFSHLFHMALPLGVSDSSPMRAIFLVPLVKMLRDHTVLFPVLVGDSHD
jgi:hypothetical protein